MTPRALGLVGLVGLALDLEVLLQTTPGFTQSRLAGTLDRPRLFGAALIKSPTRVAQPAAAALAGRHLSRQLVAARLAVDLIFGGIDGLGLLDDLPGDLFIAHRLVTAGVGVHLRPVDRDDTGQNEARLGAQLEHRAEQLGQGVLVALDSRAIVA